MHISSRRKLRASKTGKERGTLVGWIYPSFGVLVLSLSLLPLRDQVSPTTVALAFLLVVLFGARLWGSGPALLSSLLASLSLNFCFLPPYYTLTISEPENWAAFLVFLIVAVTVGHLSATAEQRAQTAEELYRQLDTAFEQASHAEALKESEALKSALLDAITHDLRTPLTSIKAAATMLIEETRRDALHKTLDPERSADLLEVINEESDRLNAFIEAMVELANIEAGQVRWKRSPISAGEIVSASLERAAGITRNNGLSVKGDPALPKLNVAPKAIAEAIYNLLDNAVKFSPEGSRILISALQVNGSVRFSIEDQAPRISIDERELIFEKFYRADASQKGFGIGLAIVKGIINAHGGTIWIEDAPKGNRFCFDLPIASSS